MGKMARITSNGSLLLADELIEETHEPTNNIELDGILRGWSGGYTTNPETPNIYYVKGLRGGFMFPRTTFEVGETYILSFKIIKTSGDILTIGGHAQSFKDMEVYLDDELIGNSWTTRLINTYPNDNLEHNYRVILTFTGTAGDSNLYIQPNRDNGYGTEYTAEVYDLKLEKINKRPPNLSLDVLGSLTTLNEIIEYPAELEGRRNLFSGEFYRDINNYDGVSTYRYHLTNLDSSKRYAVRSWVKDGQTPTSNFWITLTSGHPNPNNAGANGGTYSHIISNGSPSSSQVLARNNVPVYISYYPPSKDLSVLDKYHISIQQLDSGNISDWTLAPEDLGLEYSSDIQYFNMGIKEDRLMITELIEGGIDISTGKGSGMSSSSMYNSSYAPANLVDGSIVFGGGTGFACANNAPLPQWFQIDLGNAFYINNVKWINNRANARLPCDYRIEISMSGEFCGEEILVASKEGNTSFKWVEHRFADTKCRYVRMTVTRIYAGSYFELAEWQIFGYPAVIGSH